MKQYKISLVVNQRMWNHVMASFKLLHSRAASSADPLLHRDFVTEGSEGVAD